MGQMTCVMDVMQKDYTLGETIHFLKTLNFLNFNYELPKQILTEMVLNVSFDIEKTIWNGFECFEDGRQTALILMLMGVINQILSIFLLLAYICSDFKMVKINCLGTNMFSWEVSLFFHAQVDITVE